MCPPHRWSPSVELWGTSKPLAVRVGFGLSHWYHGDLHMQALLTLQAITGNIGVHGGGVTTFAGGVDHDRSLRPVRLLGPDRASPTRCSSR